MNKKIILIITIFTLIGLFFHFFKINQVPPCLNADELAFSYNSYSLLKTGKDEFGKILPLRLTSFGDYKLPLLSYLNIPLIMIFGLEKATSLKLVNGFILILYPFILYLFVNQLFSSFQIALLSTFLFSISWIVHSFSRQLHEALLTSFLLVIVSYFFLINLKKRKIVFEFLFNLFLLLSLFSYHSSRIFGLFFLFLEIILLIKKKISFRFLIITLITIVLFSITDFIYKPTRVNNLLFFNNQGFVNKINESIKNGGSRILYNKLSIGIKEVAFEYLKYFSPQFLVVEGDLNLRFGNSGMSPLNLIEYFFFFIGIYYLFHKKEKHRFFLVSLLLISPLPGALSWAGLSVSRTFFIFIVLIIIGSYGWVNFWRQNSLNNFNFNLIKIVIVAVFIFFSILNWDYYLNQYPKSWLNQQAWQCGYKELVNYVKINYHRFDKFYITKESGPPYIFFLYYLKYPPEKFQKQASLGKIDQYGFAQVENFDKFVFNLNYPQNKKNVVIVGRPLEIPEEEVKKIYFNNQEIFWIKEGK